jgi:hypothetical protein
LPRNSAGHSGNQINLHQVGRLTPIAWPVQVNRPYLA